jgi:hypothetical protein
VLENFSNKITDVPSVRENEFQFQVRSTKFVASVKEIHRVNVRILRGTDECQGKEVHFERICRDIDGVPFVI